MPPRTALVLFSKRPTPGAVKTRMTPPLTPEQAAELYRAMLLDTLDAARRATGVDRFLAFWPPEAAEAFRALAGEDWRLLPQRGEGLSERMAAAFTDLFSLGYDRVIAIGGDSPDMPPERLAETSALLDDHDVAVLGTEDGGYSVIALRGDEPRLFLEVSMGRDTVLRATRETALRLGLSFASRPWAAAPDLDTVEDLRRFVSAKGAGAPRTRALAARLLAEIA